MKSTGIVRGIDALGRIVLPKELRTSMHLDTDTKLEIFVDGDSIVLKKHRPAGSCDFCGEVDEASVQFAGYCICPACRRKIGAPCVPLCAGGRSKGGPAAVPRHGGIH